MTESSHNNDRWDRGEKKPELVGKSTQLLQLDRRASKRLRRRLFKENGVQCPCTKEFIPWKVIEEAVTDASVRAIIEEGNIETEDVGKLSSKVSQSAKQLFSILVDLRKCSDIGMFLAEGICDKDLPFKEDEREGYKLQTSTGKPITSFLEWDAPSLKEFYKEQWTVLAPIFKVGQHFEFPEHQILPFIRLAPSRKQEDRSGGYGEVSKAIIHPDHHDFWSPHSHPVRKALHEDDDLDWRLTSYIQVQEATVAVKALYSCDPRVFESERGILEELGSKGQHPHLVSLLCTYKWGDRYHLVFPWAEGNLCEYWEREPMPEFTEQIVHWSLRQMAGLAGGLSEIHNFKVPSDDPNTSHNARYGLHGDIKPKNSLFFKKRPNYEDPMGVLQIADFGLARFHRFESRSRVPSSVVTPSPTYSPPDPMIGDFISRTYDMWSLGCVYLEFATWLILGNEAIHEFSNCRGNTTQSGEINDDYFYTKAEDTVVVRQGVIEWVHKLKRQERCSQALLDLLELIMSKLIVIEPCKRISSLRLHKELSVIVDRAGQDRTYLLSQTNGDIEPQDLPSHQSITNNVPINAIPPEIPPLNHYSTWPLTLRLAFN